MTTTIRITKLKARMLATMDPDTGRPIAQHRIAALTGINPSSLSEYAHGKKPYTQRNLQKLCQFFGCDVNDLAGDLEITFPE